MLRTRSYELIQLHFLLLILKKLIVLYTIKRRNTYSKNNKPAKYNTKRYILCFWKRKLINVQELNVNNTIKNK